MADFGRILEEVREKSQKLDIGGINFLAVQVNITGDGGGVFYVEIKDGKISAEPYEYIDRSCAITISPQSFEKLLAGKLDPVAAFTAKKLKVDGDLGKALEFANLLKKAKK